MTTNPPVPEPTEPERQRSEQPESSDAGPARPAWDKVEPEPGPTRAQPPYEPAREQGTNKSQPPWDRAGDDREPGPDDPDPVEPNQSPSSEPQWDRPEQDSPEPEPFSGNPAPDRDSDPDRNLGGVSPEDPVPDAAAHDAPRNVHRDGTSASTPAGGSQQADAPRAGGAAPPQTAHGADAPARGGQSRNGLGTAALVCGIIAVVLSLIPGVHLFTWPLGVLAIVFGAIGWSRANKGEATNKGVALTGLVLGVLSFFTMCLVWAIIRSGDSPIESAPVF